MASQPSVQCCSGSSRGRAPDSSIMFSPSVTGKPPTMASAEFCGPIRPPHDSRSQRQDNRPPRVRRATFTLIPAAFTTAAPCKYRALKIVDSSPTAAASYAISVRQVSALPSASFRFHLAMDTLAVRLVVPLAGPTEDLHLQVIRPPPRASEQRPSRRYAPCLAHYKNAPLRRGVLAVTQRLRA